MIKSGITFGQLDDEDTMIDENNLPLRRVLYAALLDVCQQGSLGRD